MNSGSLAVLPHAARCANPFSVAPGERVPGLPLWTPTPEVVNAMLLSTDEGHAHPMRTSVKPHEGRAVVAQPGVQNLSRCRLSVVT